MKITVNLVLLSLVAVAQPSRADECLNKAITQSAMDECAGKAYKMADAELNKLYEQLRKRSTDDEQTKKLIAAQKVWVEFRDSECAFGSSGVSGGSAYPMIYGLCLADLTNQRNVQLKRYLSCKEGDLSCPVSSK